MDVSYLGPPAWNCVSNSNIFLHDTNQDYNLSYMQRNCSYFCVLSVSSLPVLDVPVYGIMM